MAEGSRRNLRKGRRRRKVRIKRKIRRERSLDQGPLPLAPPVVVLIQIENKSILNVLTDTILYDIYI